MSERNKSGLKRRADFVLPAIVIGLFAAASAQRIGAVPVPDDGDESMILQVPYEIMHHGKFAWPMYRFLGGGIDETWHSFRPVYYWLMTGFFKVFGWGLAQGRVFTLIGACLLLVFVYLVGRRLFDWRTGFIAVVALVCDPTFLERARMVRNEHVAMMFAMAAFYLYERAEEKENRKLFLASGVAAGAGVMTHTNVLYLLAAVLLLMLLRRGRRAISSLPLYLFSAGAVLAMAYEIISDLTDLANVALQYRGDRAHFNLFSIDGIWRSLSTEPNRYQRWFAGAEVFPLSSVSPTLLHVFQALIVAAVLYLLVTAVRRIRSGGAMADARVRIFIVTLDAVLFFALATGPKRKSVIYVVYLSPWFALCVGALGRDLLQRAKTLFYGRWRFVKIYRIATAVAVILATTAFALLLARQSRQYLRAVRDPNTASFEELKAALQSIVPDGVCPVSVLRPVVWLAFPESDRCYASIEGRMLDEVDIEGKEFALFTIGHKPEEWTKKPLEEYHVLGEARNTPYGDFVVYYLGVNSRYQSLVPTLYEFHGTQRGHRRIESEPQNLWSIPGSPD